MAAEGNQPFFLRLCFIQESQDGFVVEIDIRERGEETVDHQSVCFFGYTVFIPFSYFGKTDQSAGQSILKLGSIGFLPAYTGISDRKSVV